MKEEIIFDGWIDAKLLNSVLPRFIDSQYKYDKIIHHDGPDHVGFKFMFHPDRTTECDPLSPDHLAIVISRWVGRYGNNILQLRNAYLLAKLFGAKTVIAPANEFFQSREGENMSWYFGTAETYDGSLIIIGEFFPTPFHHYFKTYGGQNIGDFYNDILPSSNLKAHAGLTERDLVLFIRSGDIFTVNSKIIRNYGQPPLSFYEAVIEIEQPERIFLLAEDDASPVARALIAQGRENLSLVRLGMRGDFEFMLGSKKIATGTTSLLPNLLNLSSDIRVCYTFENGLTSFDNSFKTIIIRDKTGHYKSQVMNNNWTHSPDQLALMLEYPSYNLVVPLIGP